MYRLSKDDDYILLIIYVDDLLYIGSTDSVTTWFEGELEKDLTLTVSSTVTQYLGLNIQEGEDAIYLNAAKYADTIAKRFALTPTTISTPYRYTAGNNKIESAPLKPAGIRNYQRKLGCLLFAAVTCRPDLSYSASQLATYLKKPEAEHLAELDRALHYFVSTPTIGLTYYKNATTPTKLIGYVDADHAGDSDNRRSRTGYIYRLEPIGPISWHLTLGTGRSDLDASCNVRGGNSRSDKPGGGDIGLECATAPPRVAPPVSPLGASHRPCHPPDLRGPRDVAPLRNLSPPCSAVPPRAFHSSVACARKHRDKWQSMACDADQATSKALVPYFLLSAYLRSPLSLPPSRLLHSSPSPPPLPPLPPSSLLCLSFSRSPLPTPTHHTAPAVREAAAACGIKQGAEAVAGRTGRFSERGRCAVRGGSAAVWHGRAWTVEQGHHDA
ncbi:unnamed protein product [Closterium sp. NIES-54]